MLKVVWTMVARRVSVEIVAFVCAILASQSLLACARARCARGRARAPVGGRLAQAERSVRPMPTRIIRIPHLCWRHLGELHA